MAFLDANTKVSAAQQVTTSGLSTNAIHLADISPHRKIGTGEPIGFGIYITAAGTNSGSMVIEVHKSANSNLTSATVVSSISLATADLAAGNSFFLAIPPGDGDEEYIGLDYNVTSTVDVTFDSYLMPQSFFAENTAYANGYDIS